MHSTGDFRSANNCKHSLQVKAIMVLSNSPPWHCFDCFYSDLTNVLCPIRVYAFFKFWIRCIQHSIYSLFRITLTNNVGQLPFVCVDLPATLVSVMRSTEENEAATKLEMLKTWLSLHDLQLIWLSSPWVPYHFSFDSTGLWPDIPLGSPLPLPPKILRIDSIT